MTIRNQQIPMQLAALMLASAIAGCASNAPPANQPAPIAGQPIPPENQPGLAGNRQAPQGKIDPQAVQYLTRMCNRMTSLKQFSVRTRSRLDVVTKDGEKLQYGGVSEVWVQRPNKLRSSRIGDLTNLDFYYDGSTITLFGKGKNLYATAPAPNTLDAMLDTVRTRFGIEPAGADLLYSDVCTPLMAGVFQATDLGESMIGGEKTRHLAFREHDVDWQIWIDDDSALPREYLITTLDMPGQPQYDVELYDWNLSPRISEATFRFKPPPGAKRIDFLPVTGAVPPQSK